MTVPPKKKRPAARCPTAGSPAVAIAQDSARLPLDAAGRDARPGSSPKNGGANTSPDGKHASERRSSQVSLADRRGQLQAERDFIDVILKTQPTLILMMDSRLRLVRHNPACDEMFGPPLARMLGTVEWLGMLPEPGQGALTQALAAVRAGATIAELEIVVLDRHGDERSLMTRVTAVRQPGGGVRNLVVTGIDVTERHRAEDRAREHMDELARLQRLHTASEMAGVLAHELNQPLAAISTYAKVCHQILEKEVLDKPKLANVLERINDQSLRAGEIIRHMRRFVARKAVAPEDLDLNALIRTARALMLPSARSRNIRVLTDLATKLPKARGVPVHLEQVLLNLLRNAFDAIGDEADEGVVVLRSRVSGDRAVVTVTDSGPGLSAERAATLFDTIASEKENGLGLGLRISRSLIEANGGHLRVEPHVPGAIFQFDLPLAA